LLALAARTADSSARFIGLDVSPNAVAAAGEAARVTGDVRLAFEVADLSARLPFADASVDLVFSQNVVECLGDRDVFVAEVARILRPGGVTVVVHWDFDSQVFDGTDKDLVRRLVHAFADLTAVDGARRWLDGPAPLGHVRSLRTIRRGGPRAGAHEHHVRRAVVRP
jgi:ubiquinone/menaquinone biosynthesis C-methylase UbiE